MDVPVAYRQPATSHLENTEPSFKRLLSELFGYAIASAVALGVDIGILKALVSFAGWHYLIAATVSFMSGAVVAYALSVKLAFGARRLKSRSVELLTFIALGVVGLAVNAVVIWTCVNGIGVALLQAKLIAAVCTFFTNFSVRRALLFSPCGVQR